VRLPDFLFLPMPENSAKTTETSADFNVNPFSCALTENMEYDTILS